MLLDQLIKQARLTSHDREYSDYDKRLRFYRQMPWRNTRLIVLQRDNFECQVCKSKGHVTTGEGMVVHHIKRLEFFSSLALDVSNLITVCPGCHNSIHDTSEDDFEAWW